MPDVAAPPEPAAPAPAQHPHLLPVHSTAHRQQAYAHFRPHLEQIQQGELGHVWGHAVRRQGPAQFRVETDKGHVTGPAETVLGHMASSWYGQRLDARRVNDAIGRAASWTEPDPWSEAARHAAEGAAFHQLPHGADVLSLHPNTFGRVGKVERVADETGTGYRNRVRLSGAADYASDHVEPLDPQHSWRVPQKRAAKAAQGSLFGSSAAPAAVVPASAPSLPPAPAQPMTVAQTKAFFAPKQDQGRLFADPSAGVHYEASVTEAGHWITIGAVEGEGGEKHGGTPVFIENGRITKGTKKLVGRSIDALHEDPRFPHRGRLGREARQQGIKTAWLHQMAADVLEHDKEAVRDYNAVLKDARYAMKEFGTQYKSLRRHVGKGRDAASLKGFDEVAEGIQRQHPYLFSEDTHPTDRLLEMLVEGNRRRMTEEEAYEQALKALVAQGAGQQPEGTDDIPFAEPTNGVHYADPIRRQGMSNPQHAGAFAKEGHGVASPAAEKAQAPKLPTATQPPQLGKVARPPGAGKLAGAGAGAAGAAPAQPQAPLLQPPPPPKPGQLQQHLDSGQADAAHLLHSGDFPWHLATSADHLAMEKHLGKMDPPQFWSVAQQAAGGLAAQKNAPHAGHAAQVLKMAALHQPDGPTVPITEENQSRAIQVDWSKADPHEAQAAAAYLSGLPKVEGVQGAYYVPAGFDVQKFLGEKVPVEVSPLSMADVAAQQAMGGQAQPEKVLSEPAQKLLAHLQAHVWNQKGKTNAVSDAWGKFSGAPQAEWPTAFQELADAGFIKPEDEGETKGLLNWWHPTEKALAGGESQQAQQPQGPAALVQQYFAGTGGAYSSPGGFEGQIVGHMVQAGLPKEQAQKALADMEAAGQVRSTDVFGEKFYGPAREERAGKEEMSDNAKMALEKIKAHPGSTYSDILADYPGSIDDLHKALMDLQASGHVEPKVSGGGSTGNFLYAWHPTDKGKGASTLGGVPAKAAAKGALSPAAQKVLTALTGQPGQTMGGLEKAVGGTDADVFSALGELQKAGLAEQTHTTEHGWAWHPTEKGKGGGAEGNTPVLSPDAQKVWDQLKQSAARKEPPGKAHVNPAYWAGDVANDPAKLAAVGKELEAAGLMKVEGPFGWSFVKGEADGAGAEPEDEGPAKGTPAYNVKAFSDWLHKNMTTGEMLQPTGVAIANLGMSTEQAKEATKQLQQMGILHQTSAGDFKFIGKQDTGGAKSNAKKSAKSAPEPDLTPTAPAFTAPPLATVLPDAKTIGTLPGSTAPKLLEAPDGKKYVLKTGANPRQALQEHAADSVYKALGLPVPQSQLVDVNGKPAKLAEHLDGQNLFDWMKDKTPAEHAAMFGTIAQGFAADALLANWDVIGAGGTAYDNIFVGADGTPYRIDNGGAFEHGGMGEKKKGKLAAGRVSELETMLDPHINPTTAAVFGHLTPAQISQQVEALVGKRDAILAAVPADLRQTVAARLNWMAEHYAGHEGAVAPESMYAGKGKNWKATPPDAGNGYAPAPQEASSALFKNYADLSETREHVSKKDLPASFVSHMQGVADALDDGQKKSLTAYTGSMYSGLNAAMRKCPETLDCLDDSQQKHAERIDRAVAAAGKFAQPVNLWRGISVDEKTAKAMAAVAKKALESGDDVRMPGFKSFSYSKDHAFKGNVNFEVKARGGLLAQPLSQIPSEKEFITAHNVRYKVLDVKEAGSKTTIWMEEL